MTDPQTTPQPGAVPMSAEEVPDYDDAKQAWCDSTADLLRPTGVDDPDSVAESLFHAGLSLVPAVPSKGLTEDRELLAEVESLLASLGAQYVPAPNGSTPTAKWAHAVWRKVHDRLAASVPAVGPSDDLREAMRAKVESDLHVLATLMERAGVDDATELLAVPAVGPGEVQPR